MRLCVPLLSAVLVGLLLTASATDLDPFVSDDEIYRADQKSYETQTEYPNGVNVIPGEAELDYPTFHLIPKTSFTCEGKIPGFYADVEARCQAWHTCDVDARMQTFLCPNGTIYSQEKRVCEWWYNVNCDVQEINRYLDQNRELYISPRDNASAAAQVDIPRVVPVPQGSGGSQGRPNVPQQQQQQQYSQTRAPQQQQQQQQQQYSQQQRSQPQQQYRSQQQYSQQQRPQQQQQQYSQQQQQQSQQRQQEPVYSSQQNYSPAPAAQDYSDTTQQQQQDYSPAPTQQSFSPAPVPQRPQGPSQYRPAAQQTNVSPSQSKPQQNFAPTPPQSRPQQQNYTPAPPPLRTQQQNYSPAPSPPRPQQQSYSPAPSPPKPQQQNYSPAPSPPKPQQQNYSPAPSPPKPQQQNYSPAPSPPKPQQQNYSPAPAQQRQQNYSPAPQQPRNQNFSPAPSQQRPQQQQQNFVSGQPQQQSRQNYNGNPAPANRQQVSARPAKPIPSQLSAVVEAATGAAPAPVPAPQGPNRFQQQQPRREPAGNYQANPSARPQQQQQNYQPYNEANNQQSSQAEYRENDYNDRSHQASRASQQQQSQPRPNPQRPQQQRRPQPPPPQPPQQQQQARPRPEDQQQNYDGQYQGDQQGRSQQAPSQGARNNVVQESRPKGTPPPPPPPPQQKFRHSTPRKHNVKFGSPSRQQYYDDGKESQIPSESQQQGFPYSQVYNRNYEKISQYQAAQQAQQFREPVVPTIPPKTNRFEVSPAPVLTPEVPTARRVPQQYQRSTTPVQPTTSIPEETGAPFGLDGRSTYEQLQASRSETSLPPPRRENVRLNPAAATRIVVKPRLENKHQIYETRPSRREDPVRLDDFVYPAPLESDEEEEYAIKSQFAEGSISYGRKQ